MQMHSMVLSITLFVLNCLGWRVRMAIKYQQEAKTRTLETFEAKPKYIFLPNVQHHITTDKQWKVWNSTNFLKNFERHKGQFFM